MAARTEPQPQPEPAGRAAQGTRKSHPRATMLPARTVLLLSLLLTFSLHHATGKEPQGLLLLQVRALSSHWGGQAGTPEGSGAGAADGSSTPCSGQGSTSWDAGRDGEGAGCSQQSQTWGGAAGAWRRLWQVPLDEQGVGWRENRQLFGAFQNTLQAALLPWKAPKPHPQTEHPSLTVCSGGCSNLGCEGSGPRLSPAPPLSMSQSWAWVTNPCHGMLWELLRGSTASVLYSKPGGAIIW